MKVQAVQFKPVLGNLEVNFKRHEAEIAKAVSGGFDLILFPELSLSGYQLKDLIWDTFINDTHPIFRSLCEMSRDIDILVGAPFEEERGIIFNSALYFSKGMLHHQHRKTQLPNFGMFEEAMIFKAGDRYRPFQSRTGHRLGILICREILFPTLAYLYFIQGVEFLIGISNSPFRGLCQTGFSSHALWERMGDVFSIHYQMNYSFVNRVGFEDGIGFGGGSFHARAGIGIINRLPYFEEGVLDHLVDWDALGRARLGANYLRDDQPRTMLRELDRILNAEVQ